jgi:hypothetical protein
MPGRACLRGSAGWGYRSAQRSDTSRAITIAVDQILKKISNLIETGIKELSAAAARMLATDAAIEVVGGGPEDPLADLVALGYSVSQMYRMYKIVSKIITAISVIEKMIEGAHKLVEELGKALDGVKALMAAASKAAQDPSGSFHDLVTNAENRGVEFEKNGGWNPTLGASRIAMLPAE